MRQADVMDSLLRDGIAVRFRVMGSSMEPALSGGAEVLVRPLAKGERPAAGAVVLARQGPGRVVLHRLRAWKGSRAVLQGDAARRPDAPVGASDLLGIVEEAPRRRAAGRLCGLAADLLAEWSAPSAEAFLARLARHMEEAERLGFLSAAREGWERGVAGHLPSGGTVLLFGAGARACAAGLRPGGLRAAGRGATVADAPPWDPARAAGTFDAVVLAPRFYSLLPGSARRVATLAALRARLRPDGTLLLSILSRGGRLRARALLSEGSRAVRSAFLPAAWERGDGLSRYAAGTGLGAERLYFHAFARGEAEREAARAGLRGIRREGEWILARR